MRHPFLRNSFFLLALPGALFFGLFLWISYYNRLSVDDFFFLRLGKDLGIVGAAFQEYRDFCGRWFSYILVCTVLKYSSYRYCLLLFNLFTWSCLVAVFGYFLNTVINVKAKLEINKRTVFLFSILSAVCFFYSSFGIAETWFWLIQVCTYLWSLIAMCFLFTTLMQERTRFWHWLGVVFAAVLIGGCSESYAVMTLLLLGMQLMSPYFFRKKKLVWALAEGKQWIGWVTLVVLLISFAITAFAPGNAVRSAMMPPPGPARFVFVQGKEFVRLLVFRLPLVLCYTGMLSLPWLLLGCRLSEGEGRDGVMLRRKLLRLAAGVVGFIFIMLLPTSYFLSELAPDRGLSLISLVLCLAIGRGYFLIGQYVGMKAERGVRGVYVTLAVCLSVFGLLHQPLVARNYARAYDERNAALLKLEQEGRRSLVKVPMLPPSGMLYSFEITGDTTDYRNEHLKLGLGLHFPIISQKGMEPGY